MSSPETLHIRTDFGAWLHFAGVGGSGMSALAQFHALAGGLATGSDRAFDQGERAIIRDQLAGLGIAIVPQDGRVLENPAAAGLATDRACDAVVVSTAVESQVPDIAVARRLGIPVVHRSELLSRYVQAHRTIAVTGTSGKSTVVGMVFGILRHAGLGCGLLTGGPLTELVAEGRQGNAWGVSPAADGGLPWLVIEADESDGSLVRYRPWLGAVLNLGLDHKEPAEVLDLFTTFAANTTGPMIIAAVDNLAGLRPDAARFGLQEGSSDLAGTSDISGTFATDVTLTPTGSSFLIDGVPFTLPVAGRHNVLNATAALAICREAGVPLADMAAPLARFAGVARRFQSLGTAAGVEVIDDFAHNPDKIAASLDTAAARTSGRILAVFQPHGFGPTRFLRAALVEAFASGLRRDDMIWMPEIYYGGGTVTRDISSADLIGDLQTRGRDARFVQQRQELVAKIIAAAEPGDLVLIMGARDPSLTEFARKILAGFAGR